MPNRRIFSADLAAPFVAPLSLWPSVNISPLPSFIFTIRCSLKTFSQLDGWVTDALGNPSKMRTKKKKSSLSFPYSLHLVLLWAYNLALGYILLHPRSENKSARGRPFIRIRYCRIFSSSLFLLAPKTHNRISSCDKTEEKGAPCCSPLLVVGSVIQH